MKSRVREPEREFIKRMNEFVVASVRIDEEQNDNNLELFRRGLYIAMSEFSRIYGLDTHFVAHKKHS